MYDEKLVIENLALIKLMIKTKEKLYENIK